MIEYCNRRLEREINSYDHNSTICLADHKLTDRNMTIIVQEAIINKNCRKLWLTKNQIGVDGTLILAHALYGNTSLTELSLNNNHITDMGVQYLVSIFLQHNSSLRVLSLSSNKLTDISVQYLANLLDTDTTLTELWLAFNEISDRGVQLFTNVLTHHNNILKVLCLSSNIPRNDSSVHTIINMAKFNQSLKAF